jgi:murein DD-endopeptidase MepM/ murein hydrolase activator NlpD
MSKKIVLRALAFALVVATAVPSVANAAWPVASRSSYVSQRYSSYHRGLDIAGTYGVRVMPITGGTVIFAGWKRNCGGYQVWVRHSNNTYSAYYHLSRETTYAGKYVNNGSQIGNLGRTGCVTGAHTHVEVWKGYPWRTGSYRVNPWNYVMSGYWLPYRYR